MDPQDNPTTHQRLVPHCQVSVHDCFIAKIHKMYSLLIVAFGFWKLYKKSALLLHVLLCARIPKKNSVLLYHPGCTFVIIVCGYSWCFSYDSAFIDALKTLWSWFVQQQKHNFISIFHIRLHTIIYSIEVQATILQGNIRPLDVIDGAPSFG